MEADVCFFYFWPDATRLPSSWFCSCCLGETSGGLGGGLPSRSSPCCLRVKTLACPFCWPCITEEHYQLAVQTSPFFFFFFLSSAASFWRWHEWCRGFEARVKKKSRKWFMKRGPKRDHVIGKRTSLVTHEALPFRKALAWKSTGEKNIESTRRNSTRRNFVISHVSVCM